MKNSDSLKTKLCKCCHEAILHNLRTLASLRFRFWCGFAWQAAILLTGAVVSAQSYSIDWYKISSGGGASWGGIITSPAPLVNPRLEAR